MHLMNRLKACLSALLFLSLLSACGSGEVRTAQVQVDALPPAAPIVPGHISVLPAGTLDAPPDKTDRIFSLSYDLGGEAFGGMPFRVRGHLSLPEEGSNLPLVLLLHGAHDAKNEDARFDEGFSYLTDALARRGYAAASLDIQPAYVWKYGKGDDDIKAAEIAKTQLGYFRRAVDGEALFPIDLTGRLDLDRLILAGHSRGGDTALELANTLDGAVGAVAIAPGLRKAEKDWRDIPVAVLIPELDGDVSDLDGYAYLYTLYGARRSQPAAATLLRGGNHNYFNSRLTVNDAERFGAQVLTPEAQRDFLCRYLAAFCDYAAGGTEAGTLFDFSAPVPAVLYGQAADTLFVSSRLTLLSDLSQGAPVTPGAAAERVTVNQLTTDIRIPLSWGTDQALTFRRLRLERKGAGAELPLNRLDLSAFSGLALDLAPAPDCAAAQSLLLVLEDADGNSASAALPPLRPAAEGADYTTFTQMRIPLPLFEGVDLSRLSRAALASGQDEACGIFVSAVYGY